MPQNHALTRNILFIAFDGVQSLDVTGPMEVFAVANQLSRRKVLPYQITLGGYAGKDIQTNAGLKLSGTQNFLKFRPKIDTLIIAGGSESTLRNPDLSAKTLKWITQQSSSCRRIASICTGAFVLAATGLLDGRRASTHWNSCSLFKSIFPNVLLEPDSIFTKDKKFYTSAGVTAGIDLCLALVEEDLGAEVALAVARELVVFIRRPGGQSQFSKNLEMTSSAFPKLNKLVLQIIDEPQKDYSREKLAEMAGLSERHFSRVFTREFNTTPAEFVQSARLERAKTLLETSDWSLLEISEKSGFGSLDTLHRVFAKKLRLTPQAYRHQFSRRRKS